MIEILQTDWNTNKVVLKIIPEAVFIQEQKVPAALEWDSKDMEAIHLLAINTDQVKEPVGASRIIINNHQARIGRMAVLKKWRTKGIGSQLLQHALIISKQKQVQEVLIHAQVHVIPFYQQAGFKVIGERFMDAGIPHMKMQLDL